MSKDLSGGIGAEREYVFAAKPADPEMRESVNVWIWDDHDDVGFPRIGIEAVANRWDSHDVQTSISFADGRVLRMMEPGPAHDPLGADGKPRVLGAGPLSFELVEPFVAWRMHLDGLLQDTTAERQMGGEFGPGERTVPVELDIEMRSAVPPWENGKLRPEAGRVLAEQEEGALMGGPRFEQLFRMTGRLVVDGHERQLNGGGLRIRRQGVRRLARFWGHAWQSTVFPSGRAFGFLAYPPRTDGLDTYNEAFIYEGDGELIPARVVEAPWMGRMQPRGQKFRAVLETDDGRVESIDGESVVSVFSAIPVTGDFSFPVLQQAIVRYTWDGETSNGMMERSTLPQELDPA